MTCTTQNLKNINFMPRATYDALVTKDQTQIYAIQSSVVIDSWKSADSTNWWRKWSDGWIEQGGFLTAATSNQVKTVTFPLPFSELKNINIGFTYTSGSSSWEYSCPRNLGNTAFTITSATSPSQGTYWKAEGFTA